MPTIFPVTISPSLYHEMNRHKVLITLLNLRRVFICINESFLFTLDTFFGSIFYLFEHLNSYLSYSAKIIPPSKKSLQFWFSYTSVFVMVLALTL